MQCTLNEYGSDALVQGDTRGLESTPAKSGSLFALHTDRLSFRGIDAGTLERSDLKKKVSHA